MKKRVCVPVLNLYARPQSDGEVVSQALYGWFVHSLETQGAFEWIQMEDGYQGWALSSQLDQSLPENSTAVKAQVRHNAAHLYAVPHVNRHAPLLTLPFEVELDVLAEPSDEDFRWIEVALVGGRKGWIQRGNVCLHPKRLSLQEMLNLSAQFLGLPYTWGGRSSFGFDCSGFIQMLFKQMGIHLPRDAREQILAPLCEDVCDLPQAGDLLFFGLCSSDIKHVGLYLGNERLIHASVKPLPLLQLSFIHEPSLQRFAYRTFRRLSLEEEIRKLPTPVCKPHFSQHAQSLDK